VSLLSGFARGFLSLVDSQNFGEAPRELSGTLIPTVDIAGLYLLNKQTQAAFIVAAPANGSNPCFTVPRGEVWRLHSCHSLAITGAGVTLDHQPYMTVDGASLYMGEFMSNAANQWRSCIMKAPSLWLPSGAVLGVAVQALVGVPTTVAMTACYSRLTG
jgi:hypothetical protein